MVIKIKVGDKTYYMDSDEWEKLQNFKRRK
jgi:hypothetical protein